MYNSDNLGSFNQTRPVNGNKSNGDGRPEFPIFRITNGTPQEVPVKFDFTVDKTRERYIPEYKIIVIVEKAVGSIAPNLIRRQLTRLGIKKNRLEVDRFPDFIKALEEATTFLCSKSIRAKMIKELKKMGEKYR